MATSPDSHSSAKRVSGLTPIQLRLKGMPRLFWPPYLEVWSPWHQWARPRLGGGVIPPRARITPQGRNSAVRLRGL